MKVKLFLLITLLFLLVSPALAAYDISIGDYTFEIHNDEQAVALRTANVPIIITDSTDGISGYELIFTSSNEDVVKINDITFPPAFLSYGASTFQYDSSNSVKVTGLDIDDVIQAGDLSSILCYVELYWIAEGEATISATATQLDDDSGAHTNPIFDFGAAIVDFIGNLIVENWYPTVTFDASYDYDMNNGTYTKYWLNQTITTGNFPMYDFAVSLLLPILNIFNYWFFILIYFTYLAITWIRSGEIYIPLVIGILSAGMFGLIFPPEAKAVGIVLFALCMAVLLTDIFISRR